VKAGAFGWQVGKAAHNHSHHSHARACWDAATRRPCAQRYLLKGCVPHMNILKSRENEKR
jgi:hypothetical protein